MEKYYDKFEENECNDLESIPLFDDEFLKDEIGIKNKILRKKFLINCDKMNKEMIKFKTKCGINEYLYDQLSKYGIVTLTILCDSITNKKNLSAKYSVNNDNQCELLWKLKEKHENDNVELPLEGA